MQIQIRVFFQFVLRISLELSALTARRISLDLFHAQHKLTFKHRYQHHMSAGVTVLPFPLTKSRPWDFCRGTRAYRGFAGRRFWERVWPCARPRAYRDAGPLPSPPGRWRLYTLTVFNFRSSFSFELLLTSTPNLINFVNNCISIVDYLTAYCFLTLHYTPPL